MPFEIVRNDITKMKVDAIVNAANEKLAPGGGVCGAIHKAAGPELAAACALLGGCETGKAKITPGYSLPAKYVIHTPGPRWSGGLIGEKEKLYGCYYNSLALARENRCKSIAFPLISSGIYGYPKSQAFRVASDAIRDFLMRDDCDPDFMVYLVVFDRSSLLAGSKLYANITEYIDDHYAEAHTDFSRRLEDNAPSQGFAPPDFAPMASAPAPKPRMARYSMAAPASLEDALGMLDESFTEMLLRKIDEKGFKKDSECYKAANIDRKLFSKIRSDMDYKPKKTTALALAVALKLTLEETKELLMKAGYSLSHSSKMDLIVEYFIINCIYDIDTITEALYRFDQPLLGGRAS